MECSNAVDTQVLRYWMTVGAEGTKGGVAQFMWSGKGVSIVHTFCPTPRYPQGPPKKNYRSILHLMQHISSGCHVIQSPSLFTRHPLTRRNTIFLNPKGPQCTPLQTGVIAPGAAGEKEVCFGGLRAFRLFPRSEGGWGGLDSGALRNIPRICQYCSLEPWRYGSTGY